MANFIDFVVKVSKDKAVGKEFKKMLQKSSPSELSEWFSSNNFSISEEETKKLIENKDNIAKSSSLRYY